MEIEKLFGDFIKEFKSTEEYRNLSQKEKSELDKVLKKEILHKRQPKRSRKKVDASTTFQLKIALKGAKPPIWRRILVPSDITFVKLHIIIQTAMGWEGGHLYLFKIGDALIEEPDPEGNDFFLLDFQETYDAGEEKIKDWFANEKDKATYIYDFGDNWEHSITLEKIETGSDKLEHPICLKGKRACPPEDIGGIDGYYSLLEGINNPGSDSEDDYTKELREWYSDFDPESFDIDETNERLQEVYC